jgi:branched-chain amino acid transport system substrate-binding protein
MKKLVEWHQKNHPGDTHDTNYVRGWSYVMVWSEALKRADKAGKLNGPGIRAALETLKDFDLGGLTPAVTYGPDDHRSTTSVSLYQVKGGKLEKVKDFQLPRKPEWLGL